MRYFIIESDPEFNDLPFFRDWHQKIDVRFIKKGLTKKLPFRELVFIYPNPELVFSGVIIKPFILLTREIKNIVSKYQRGVVYKEIVLLDDENELTQLYYLAIVDEVDCLHESSGFNRQGTVLEKPVLIHNMIRDKSLFKIADTCSSYTVIRLDLLESVLRRDVRGLQLTPVDLC